MPYPYKAMLAICSDLDETPDRRVYWEIMRFLNTRQETAIGPGLGLEVGNSIYFDMPQDQFAYWNTDDVGRTMVHTLIRSGHIDCLHSFGDLATTRVHAERALDELVRYDSRLSVWVDHGVAPSNFGADIMSGMGDVPESAVYHADLTCAFGIKYVWRGRVTSIIGQNLPRSLQSIYNARYPLKSARTLMKEFLKGSVSRGQHAKYAMHVSNDLLRDSQLRSGHAVCEFIRANPHWGGVSCGETADGLAEVLNERMLTRLIQREGVCILYTHLGKCRQPTEPLGHATRVALQRLARLFSEGCILVSTTYRLLNYCNLLRTLNVETRVQEGKLRIFVGSSDPTINDYSGLSFHVPDPDHTEVWINGSAVHGLRRHRPDNGDHPSVSIPWQRLEFPSV
ncbi:MAG: hypothetical protein AB7G75_14980 [Candidatus Binatia bacterium]